MLSYDLNESKINSYAMIKLICILKLENNRRLNNMVAAHQEHLPKENNFVNVFSVMKQNFSCFKKFSGEAVADHIT